MDESIALCDEVLAKKPTDDAVLTAMTHVLRNLGRRTSRILSLPFMVTYTCPTETDIITMFENAYKQQPQNEELAANVFLANVRTGNWKAAQQVRTHHPYNH